MIDVKNTAAQPRRRGRPPAFDRGEVLQKAAETFWRLGYEGASIVDLTTAMGITPQSLYAAFGSKARLYAEALAWYREAFTGPSPQVLDAPDPIGTLRDLLIAQAERFTDPAYPRGCMISTAVLGCAAENDDVARMVAELRQTTVDRIRARLERGQRDGEVRADADPAALARFCAAMVQGMSVQARDGADRAEMVALAEIAGETLERHRA